MFNKILITNRGEIACRIIRTAKRLGIQTAVIYSPVEAQALHVRMADEAMVIEADTPRASYLAINTIITIAKQIGAQAIHPGYGFLSENSEFARACQHAGIVFIGPSPQALELMGEKDQAKQVAEQIGVPIIKGYMDEDQSIAAFVTAAQKIGFPLLIKAIAGGGGKAQHIVNNSEELTTLLPTAHREAQQSFANPQLMLEKYLPNVRHIEVQIFGDNFGHYVHLFDRDCSVQRRYQKILEEALAYDVSPVVRNNLYQDALKIAQHIGYVGAGTIEFLVAEEAHYFLEMNTRLQVEHPVTESITGIDLVEWQLRVAAGEPLTLTQNAISAKGHAIEVRICAEDPAQNFLPAIGKIDKIIVPPQVRFESGVQEGDSITPYFDSLVAKLIVTGESRQQAFFNLQRALAQTTIMGVATNLNLLQMIASQTTISEMIFHTNWLEHHPELYQAKKNLLWLVFAAAYQYCQLQPLTMTSPWEQRDGWKLNLPPSMLFNFKMDNNTYAVSLQGNDPMQLTCTISMRKEQSAEKNNFTLRLGKNRSENSDEYVVHIDQQEHRFHCYASADQLHILTLTDRVVIHTSSAESADNFTDATNTPGLQSPMPGTIVQVFVQENQEVCAGDRLLTLEAMKMEYTIRAPHAGVVKKLYCKSGEVVNGGVILADIAT